MAKINLLPSDLLPKKSITKLADILAKVSYTAIALFLVFILTTLAIFFINSTEIRKLEAQEEELMNLVRQYEQTEQQVVLAKDRMSKILKIWKSNKIDKHLEAFGKLLQLSNNFSLKDVEISPEKSEISLETKSSLSNLQFMTQLVSSDIYENIRLKNFSFNPNYGYRITFIGSFKI